MKKSPLILWTLLIFLGSHTAFSQVKAKPPIKKPDIVVPKSEETGDHQEAEAENQVGDTRILEKSQTNIDFSESLIEGKMRAPSGFFIQGRLSQDLTRMVRLRTSFKPEMIKATGLPETQTKPSKNP